VASEIIWVAESSAKGYVCIANVHMLIEARRDQYLEQVLKQACLVTSDGMPLVWALRRQGHKQAGRVAGPDLTVKLCERAQGKEIPVYFFGGTTETVEKLRKAISMRFPYLRVVGFESPPVLPQRPEVDSEVVMRIKASGAKIVFVGLGCPKQEFWMQAYSPHLPAILVGVGAAFDFLAGTKHRAPVWMQNSGLEWFYRLLAEPGRLWKRYFITNTLFVWYLMRGYFGK